MVRATSEAGDVPGIAFVAEAERCPVCAGALKVYKSRSRQVITLAGGSSTWGMRLMGIRFRDHYGAPLSSGLALAHTFGYTISIAIAPLQLISIILMLVTQRGQGLTDLVLGTEAINSYR